MEELPGKRQYRKRKPVDVPATSAEAQSPANHNDGVGETGGAGHSALADDAGQVENGLGWDAFCLKVDAVVRSHGHDYVRLATFPEPQAGVIESEYPVPVQAGPVGLVNIHNQTLGI
jgi:hypothetical protein